MAAFLAELHGALGEAPAEAMGVRNPFKGLRAFGEADAPDFFGRSGEVDQRSKQPGQQVITVKRYDCIRDSKGADPSGRSRDAVRDELLAHKIELQDGPDGTAWSVKNA